MVWVRGDTVENWLRLIESVDEQNQTVKLFLVNI